MFNVHINNGTNVLPEDDIFYIIAKEGIFLKKKLGVMESVAPVKSISTLHSVATSAKMNINKIPASSFAKVVDFFKKVYEEHRGEAVVLLFYQEDTKKYRIVPPHQKVSGTSIDYNRGISIKGWTMIGTIHSHASMSAFHSGTDDSDEKSFDGLHITIGNVNSENFSISASIVANGYRVHVNPEEYVLGIKKVVDIDETKPYYASKVYKYIKGKMQLDEDASKKYLSTHRKLDKRYQCMASPSKSVCNPKWLSVVEKGVQVWRGNYGHGYGGYGGYRFMENGYDQHYDPHAWRNHGRFKQHNIPRQAPTRITNSSQLQISNQSIINDLNLDDEPCSIPCLLCKHREEKLFVEEEELLDNLLFYCTQCGQVYTEEQLEDNDSKTELECPKCKTGDHFTVLDDSDLTDKFEKISAEQIFNSQPDQEGFFSCKTCGISFLKFEYDTECPYCKSSFESTEERLENQVRADSGEFLGEDANEINEEALKQTVGESEVVEIPDPKKKGQLPLPLQHNSNMGLLNMFKNIFGKGD